MQQRTTSPEETGETTFAHYHAHHVHIRRTFLPSLIKRLFVGFDHAHRIRDDVRDYGRHEANQRIPKNLIVYTESISETQGVHFIELYCEKKNCRKLQIYMVGSTFHRRKESTRLTVLIFPSNEGIFSSRTLCAKNQE